MKLLAVLIGVSLVSSVYSQQSRREYVEYIQPTKLIPMMEYCPTEPIQLFSDLWQNCFERRETQENTSLSTEQLLSQDKMVCDCLAKSPMGQVAISRLPSTILDKFDEKTRTFIGRSGAMESQIKIKNKILEVKRNGMLFEASLLSDDNDKNFAALYSQNNIERMFKDNNKEGMLTKVKQKFVKNGLDYLDSDDKKSSKEYLTSKAALISAPKLNENLFIHSQPKNPDLHCIGPKEYLAFRKLPQENEFYSSLAKMNGFNEKDWDVQHLQKEIENKIKKHGPNHPQVQTLKTRMVFLYRNPMIRNLFAASNKDNDDYYDAMGLSREEQKEIRRSTHWNHLQKRKIQFFNVLKKQAKSLGTCSSKPGGCLNEMSKQENLQEFYKSTREFFSQPDVAFITNLEAEKDMVRDLHEMADFETYDQLLPRTQQGLASLLAILDDKDKTTNPNACKGNNIDLNKCLASFGKYCPLVEKSFSQAAIKADPAELARAERRYSFVHALEPDIDKNPEMSEFNQNVCHTKRKLTKSFPGLDERATFFEFKQKFCSNNPRANECKEGERNNLVALYLDLYGERDQSNLDPDLLHEQDAEIAAFKNYIKDFKPHDYDKASFTELAKRSINPVEAGNLASTIAKAGSAFDINKVEAEANPVNADASRASLVSSGLQEIGDALAPMQNDESSLVNTGYVVPTASAAGMPMHAQARPAETNAQNNRKEREKTVSAEEKEGGNVAIQESHKLSDERIKMMQELYQEKERLAKMKAELLESELASVKSKLATGTGEDNEKLLPEEVKEIATYSQDNFAPAAAGDEGTSSGAEAGGVGRSVASAYGGEGGYVAGIAAGGGTEIQSKAGRTGASMNSALLQKYGIVIQGDDSSGLLFAQEKSESELQKLTEAGETKVPVSLEVSAEVYQAFANKNLDVLKNFEEQFKDAPDVVKVLVKAPGKEHLEYYAIQESGKVVFQPVLRKSTRSELLSILPKS